MTTKVKANWKAQHGPFWGALNASSAAAVFTMIADLFGISVLWGPVTGVLCGVVAYFAARHSKITVQSAAWRAAAWVLVGVWTCWARLHETPLTLPFVGEQSYWWANGGNWGLLLLMFLVAGVGGKWLTGRTEDPEVVKAREQRTRLLKQAERYNRDDGSIENVLADDWEKRIARVDGIGRLETAKVKDLAADPSGKTLTDLIHPKTGKPVQHVVGGVEIFQLDLWKNDQGEIAKTYNERTKKWEPDGFTFHAVLPEGGHSWRSLNGPALANDARLPKGCVVRVTEADDRGTFICHVQLVNVLAKPRPYPTDYSVKSVLDGIHIGFEEHGKPKLLNMAVHNTTNAGAPGSGKTNVANVVGMRLAETTDALVFDYDIAGGGMSAPYFPEAWLNGDYATAPQPGVAAAAPCVELAWILSEIGVKLISARKKGYQHLKKMGEVPIGHCLDPGCNCTNKGIPLIMNRVDEGWSLYKAGDVGFLTRANLEWIAGEGRPGAERVFFGALGSTDEYIPGGVQNISPNRIALKQPNETEIGRFLGWGKGFDPDIFKKPGNAAVRDHDENLDVVKLLHLSDEDVIREGVLACSKRRPVLDSISEETANRPILIEHPDLVAYFRGKIGVVENGRYAKTGEKHWIPNGTLTITNYWKNRWVFTLPEIFPRRFSTLMEDEMRRQGWTPGQRSEDPPGAESANPTPAEVPTGSPTGGTAMTTSNQHTAASAIAAMRASEADLADALAAGEAAAKAADQRHAEKQAEVSAVQGALDGEPDGDPARRATSTLPHEFVVPDTVAGLPAEFQLRQPTAEQPEGALPRPAVAPGQRSPRLAEDPERQRLMVLGYIIAAGSEGVSVGPLRQRLLEDVTVADGGEAYTISEQAFRKSRITALVSNSLISQPYSGSDEDLLSPDGGKRSHWVATDRGVRYWEKHRGRIPS